MVEKSLPNNEVNTSLHMSSTMTIVPRIDEDSSSSSAGGTKEHTTAEFIEVGVSTVKRFNFLVAGGSGLGKSTFSMATLKRYFPDLELKEVENQDGSTKSIEERGWCEKIQDSCTKIIVTIVDTPGFGDSINNNDRITPVIRYIETQNKYYEDNEVYRYPNQQQHDTRIHCCFYFLMPHRVTPLDCEFMRLLQCKVPIVPIVAKTDTLRTKELQHQLYNIHKCLKEQKIKIFDFAETNIDESWLETYDPKTTVSGRKDDEDGIEEDSAFSRVGKSLVAAATGNGNEGDCGHHHRRSQIRNVFAVISGEREYPWGVARETYELHSDTPRLHDVLFKNKELKSLGRLRECADSIHEAWRKADKDKTNAKKAWELEETKVKKRKCGVAVATAVCYCALWMFRVLSVLPPPKVVNDDNTNNRSEVLLIMKVLVNTLVPVFCETCFIVHFLKSY